MADTEVLSGLVHCPVCFELYDAPKILKCLHVLCSRCVQKLLKEEIIKCPECRVESNHREIKGDFNKQKLVDACKKPKQTYGVPKYIPTTSSNWKCESCEFETQIVSHHCEECDKFICTTCQKVHKSFPAIKHHEMKEVGEISITCKKKLEQTSDLLEAEKDKIRSLILKTSKITLHSRQVKSQAIKSVNDQCCNLKMQIDDLEKSLINDIEHATNTKPDWANGEELKLKLQNMESITRKIYDVLTTSDLRKVMNSTQSLNDEASGLLVQSFTVADKYKLISTCPALISVITSDFNIKELIKLNIDTSSCVAEAPRLLKNYEECQKATVATNSNNESRSCEDVKQLHMVSNSSNSESTVVSNPKATADTPNIQITPTAGKNKRKKSRSRKRSSPNNLAISNNVAHSDCSNLYEVVKKNKEFRKVREEGLNIPAQRLHMVGRELWCTSEGHLRVYNLDCTLMKAIPVSHLGKAKSIIQAPNGNMIIACGNNGGLHEMDPLGKSTFLLSGGSFSDLAAESDYLFALEYVKYKVYVFQYNNKAWSLTTRFRVGRCSFFDTLAVARDTLHVCLWSSACVYKFSFDGTALQKHDFRDSDKERETKPKICQSDKFNNILMADFWNKDISVMDQSGARKTVTLKRLMENPIDAVFDSDYNDIYVLTRAYDEYCLEKFSSDVQSGLYM